MNIKILSRKKIREELNANPGKYTAVIISEPQIYAHNKDEVSDLFPLCKEYLDIRFNDTTFPERHNAPTLENMATILEWAKKQEDKFMLVACRAGISRSSATAYLIECQRSSPQEAIKILDDNIHCPNELMIKYGAVILGQHVIPPIKEFLEKTQGYCFFD
jgi:predicted protein tyrosine phosphatase